MAVTIRKDKSKVCATLVIKAGEGPNILKANEREYLRRAYLQSRDKRLYDTLAFHGCQGGLPMPGVESHP